MKRAARLSVWLFILVAPVAASAATASLTPFGRRTSNMVVARDLAALSEWQARVQQDTTAGAAAASVWLAAAREAYLEDDASGFDAYAFSEAQAAWQAGSGFNLSLPANTNPGRIAEYERLRTSPGTVCANALLAQAAVALSIAAQSTLRHGKCAAEPMLATADRLLALANERAAACAPAVAAPAPVAQALEADAPVVQPALAMPSQEELRIPRDVYFALARHDLSPVSLQVIDGIAALLVRYPSLQAHLVGHTDSRASAAFNLALSGRRVASVRAALLERGVRPEQLTVEAKGKAERAAAEDSRRGFALNRRVEMRFMDSEGRVIEAEHQEQDLQLEPEPVAPRQPGRH